MMGFMNCLPAAGKVSGFIFPSGLRGWLQSAPREEDLIIKRTTRSVNELRHKPPPFFCFDRHSRGSVKPCQVLKQHGPIG
jgi:hypothetical protein